MTLHPAVLVGLSGGDLRDRLVTWIRGWGYETVVASDGHQTVARLRERPFTVSFLDTGLEPLEGHVVWRVVRPIVGRRMVLMARERRNDLWFEALGAGVVTLLPLPPGELMVRAALDAVTRRLPRVQEPSGSA